MYIHIYLYIYIYAYIYIHIYINIRVCVYIYIYVYIYMCTHLFRSIYSPIRLVSVRIGSLADNLALLRTYRALLQTHRSFEEI